MSELIGRTLGPYRILEQLGMGGMATVYKAYQPAMDRNVAVKVLPRHFAADPTFVGRFEQEAKALAKLENARILPVFDYGEEDGVTYIVMRYLDAGTLSERIRNGAIPLDEISRIITQIAEGLDYAHKKGVIHRDIKPSNIMLDANGDVYVTDFGISKLVEGTAQFTGSGIVGTPDYVSPEQAMGQPIDTRSDIYSLGIVLYQMATRDVPFHAETPMAVIIKHINDPLPLPRTLAPDLPEAVENVILKALAKKPEERFQTCGEMAKALRKAVESGVSPDKMPTSHAQGTAAMASPQSTMGAGTMPMAAASAGSAPTAVAHKTEPMAKKKANWLVPALIVVGLIVLLGGGFVVLRAIQRARQANEIPTPTIVVGVAEAPSTEMVGAAPPPVEPALATGGAPSSSLPFGVIYDDNFDGGQPKAEWRPLNMTPDMATVEDGRFKLMTVPGATFVDVGAGRSTLGLPVLSLAVPDQLAEYTVQVDLAYKPTQNYEFAGLMMLTESPNGERQLPLFALGRAFCDGPVCQGDAIYFDSMAAMLKGINDSSYHPPIAGAGQLPAGVVTLRLSQLHGRVVGQYSLDKQTWHMVGEWPLPIDRIKRVGLFTNAGGQAIVEIPAYFDNFIVTPPQ